MSHAVDQLPPLKETIAAHNLIATKTLGQNFLLDLNLTAKIVRLAEIPENSDVIEIGPGPGGLTRALVKSNANSVTAIDFDERAVSALQDLVTASDNRLHVIQGDALEKDLTQFGQDGKRHLVANLPYNIATPLLTGWLKQIYDQGDQAFASMTLMFQKEVADRIEAEVSSKAYGRLSVISQWLCHVERVITLPPQAFSPPPKIHSSVIRFTPKTLNADKPGFKEVETLTAAAFGQRRKMLRASCKAYLPALEKLAIDPTLRAENLTVQQFINIAKTHNDG